MIKDFEPSGRPSETGIHSPAPIAVGWIPANRTATPQEAQAAHLAGLAVRALIEEAELTPKPALVDERGTGAHTDLSLMLMRRSAWCLYPHFERMALASFQRLPGPDLREELGALGRSGREARDESYELTYRDFLLQRFHRIEAGTVRMTTNLAVDLSELFVMPRVRPRLRTRDGLPAEAVEASALELRTAFIASVAASRFCNSCS